MNKSKMHKLHDYAICMIMIEEDFAPNTVRVICMCTTDETVYIQMDDKYGKMN